MVEDEVVALVVVVVVVVVVEEPLLLLTVFVVTVALVAACPPPTAPLSTVSVAVVVEGVVALGVSSAFSLASLTSISWYCCKNG